MNEILDRLGGGDRRSIGAADTVTKKVLSDAALFAELIEGLWADDPIVRMRAADACAKVTLKQPLWLRPFAARLLKLAELTPQSELKWHLAQMIVRLRLTPAQRRRAIKLMKRQLRDASRIVRTFSLQALADLSQNDTGLRRQLPQILSRLCVDEAAAVRARARKLRAEFAAGGEIASD